MKKRGSLFSARRTERLFLFVGSVVLIVFFVTLFFQLQRELNPRMRGVQEGTVVNLNEPTAAENLGRLLMKEYYVQDPKDAAYIVDAVASKKQNIEIDNVGELNKKRFSVNANDAYTRGGEDLKKRVLQSRAQLGLSPEDTWLVSRLNDAGIPTEININNGKGVITGTITDENEVPVKGVLVKLQFLPDEDSLYASEVSSENTFVVNAGNIQKMFTGDSSTKQFYSFSAVCRTDESGHFRFIGLQTNNAYSVVPLQQGFEFGSSKGTRILEDEQEFAFIRGDHNIRLFSAKQFDDLRKENSLIVRTESEFNRWFWIIAASFIVMFWLLHLVMCARLPGSDQFILPIVMFLTGISFLMLLSMQDPLADRFLARKMWQYFLGGGFILLFIQMFDLKRFTPDSKLYRLFLPLRFPRFTGLQWVIVALILLVCTIFFGTGPEGSGVKVNLLGIQPSEVIKYLLILFVAAFFSERETMISDYVSVRKRFKYFNVALISVVFTLLLFLVVGDLGPAVVCCFTFIVLFSFARGDFKEMALTVVAFVVCTWITKQAWIATVAVIIFLLLYKFIKNKFSESSVMALVVLATFLLLDSVPFLGDILPGPIGRLTDRKAIWENPWNNEVYGGDHIAHSIWGISTGGLQGQGIGNGFSKTIPEAHTDMILPAIGEELGWMGVVSVLLLFFLFLHRCILIGRRSGRPFLFYLCSGIGVSAFIQFVLIAGGSTGALPLSGVALPFISYGGSSLICNMIAAGFVLSASAVKGSELQMEYIREKQDRNLLPTLITGFVATLLLAFTVSQYLLRRDDWMIKPSLIVDRSGFRQMSYNPRISILIKKLEAGNLRDRNGVILAASSGDTLMKYRAPLFQAGADPSYVSSVVRRRSDRYYPFGDKAFFWVGDLNSNVFLGSLNGYFAEYRHGPELRGFRAESVVQNVQASRYRPFRFSKERSVEVTVAQRDYSELAPLLKAGINSDAVKEFKKRNRDVYLTVDAALQNSLQQLIAADTSLNYRRVSVVIGDDSNGDVLASAMYPLPPINDWEILNASQSELNKSDKWLTTQDLGFTYATQPGSTAKIVTALAAYNKLGTAASSLQIQINPGDLIRVKSEEPDEAGNIGIERAFVRSNNPFFIRLANEKKLEHHMADLYLRSGFFLAGIGGYFYEYDNDRNAEARWKEMWEKTEFKSRRYYSVNNPRRTRGAGISGMSWGQGQLIATPAAVVRLVSGIANGGQLMQQRFMQRVGDSIIPVKKAITLTNAENSAAVAELMRKQSEPKKEILKFTVSGKTGTPERIRKGERITDGWYTFFVPKATGTGHIVVCIRVENCKGSSVAVRAAGNVVIPELLRRKYIANQIQPTNVREQQ
jgi:cell division protein FtsW (lipid II flippase)